jgi:hypothetical protein
MIVDLVLHLERHIEAELNSATASRPVRLPSLLPCAPNTDQFSLPHPLRHGPKAKPDICEVGDLYKRRSGDDSLRVSICSREPMPGSGSGGRESTL